MKLNWVCQSVADLEKSTKDLKDKEWTLKEMKDKSYWQRKDDNEPTEEQKVLEMRY